MTRSIASSSLLCFLFVCSSLGGCAIDEADQPIGKTTARLMNAVCSAPEQSTYSFFHVQPDLPVDYLSIRNEHRDSTRWDVTTDEERGALCANATDATACKKKVDDLRRLTQVCDTFSPEQGCFAYYFVATRGDEVIVASEVDEIRQLIGRVDDPNEAMTLASRGGRYQVTCGPKDVPSEWAAVDDGYELTLQRVDCSEQSEVVRYKARVHVHADGRVEELSSEEFSRGVEPGACVPLPTTNR